MPAKVSDRVDWVGGKLVGLNRDAACLPVGRV